MVALEYVDMAEDVNASSTCGKKDTLMSSNAARSSFSYGEDTFLLWHLLFFGPMISVPFFFFFNMLTLHLFVHDCHIKQNKNNSETG